MYSTDMDIELRNILKGKDRSPGYGGEVEDESKSGRRCANARTEGGLDVEEDVKDEGQDEEMMSLIEGMSIGSGSIGGGDVCGGPDAGDQNHICLGVFTEMAKAKLEGMMGGLLLAMVKKLRAGQEGMEMDIEASPHELQIALGGIARTEAIRAGEEDQPKFWPFKATKTDDKLQKEEDKRRKILRNPKFDPIPDLWKYIWPSEWATEELRHSLIKDLALALHHYDTTYLYLLETEIDFSGIGHIYSILSVIGPIIGSFCSEDDLDSEFRIVSPQSGPSFAVIVTRAVIEAVHVTHDLRIDRLLRACYEKDRCYYGPSMVLRDVFYDKELKKLSPSKVLAYYQGLDFNNFRDRLCRNTGLVSKQLPAESVMKSFRTYDLHVHSLASLGNLKIEWTFDARSHLSLEFPYRDGRDRLRLFWFGCGTLNTSYYIANLLVPKSNDNKEIGNTMKILLGSSNRSQQRMTRKAYAALPAPWWLFPSWKYGSSKMQKILPWYHMPIEDYTLGDIMKYLPPDGIGGMAAHLSYKSEPNRCWRYSEFPTYGARPHELRLHMDGVRPKGFRGVFRDKRDSNVAYHTFWFAVIFGTASIFLALASLVVSSAQTWAAFHPPTFSANRPSS
ncbi:hypothetical protein BKA65DRAFT_561077 [Rhexocercosporidium sp. MPI-PUGE-AT-0058]|nr:hypothetical protein BKA65DRAFT_561077 [Rhexocercosporidium sp. MPI-PUGE-AT-0058]